MKIPSMTILSSTQSTALATMTQFKNCFKNTMDFRIIIFDDHPKPYSVEDDFILVTNMLILDEALRYIKPESKYFIAERTVNTDTVNRLYDIPEGTNVLIVNVTKDTVLEALGQLKEYGINHLSFYPYYPGIEKYNEGCEYAVHFGEPEIVPEGDYQIIDLEIRPMDMTTCVKIAIEVGLYEKVKRNISSTFMRSGIEISYNYAKQLKKHQILTDNLQLILNRFRSSVLLIDESNKIIFFNPRAKRLLKISDRTSPYLGHLIDKMAEAGRQFFFEIDEYSYYVEFFSSFHDEPGNTLIVIDDIEKIEKIESNHRAMLVKKGLVAQYTFDDILYYSDAMKGLIKKAKQFAKSNSTIAIFGESGSGKELVAQAIHNASDRKNEAFVAINFAALPPSLSDSELFGYVEGAFTGAKRGGNKGLFELAHRGTVFLDEIGDCSLDVQKKILRVIQERSVMPLGGNRVVPIDIRIISATNQDLHELAKKKLFREDLYYRLNVLPLRVPSLKERKADIIPLFLHFLNENFGVNNLNIKDELEKILINHSWHGNVRELSNVVEYVANCLMSDIPWQAQLNEILHTDTTDNSPQLNGGIQMLIDRLESDADPVTIIKILRLMGEPPYLWSRSTIAEGLKDEDITESRVKRYLSILKEHDLIQSRSGKGSYLKDLGKEVLEYYESR